MSWRRNNADIRVSDDRKTSTTHEKRESLTYPYREKESPRLMHVVALHFTLYLFWGAALVSERGVLVRKENRSGVRKGLCE